MPQAVTPSPLLSPPVVGVTLWCVNTTVGSEAEARRLAELLLQQRLAACVQIEALQSHYRWQGALMCEPEWRLSCKTLPSQGPALLAALREAHPYELSELCWTLWQASAEYGRWVGENVGPPP